MAFYIHRMVLEVSTCTLEALVAATITFLLLESRPLTTIGSVVILLTVVYYNCIASIFVLIYSTQLDRATARSISFVVQALLCITSGLWIHKGDTAVYDLISWIQYINPNYWVIPPLITSLLSSTGECVMSMDGECRLHLGDVGIVQGGIESIDPSQAILVIICITWACRIIQGALLYRDLHYPHVVIFNQVK